MLRAIELRLLSKTGKDEMYIASIKEVDMAKEMMSIHPSTCMIGADTLELTSDIDITVQQHMASNAWLNDPNQFK